MKYKLKDMTYSQWLSYNERLRKKQAQDKQNKTCVNLRFRDAQNLKRKIYRRASARLLSRIANDFLTEFNGGHIQKAKHRISFKTSIGTEIVLQKSFRNGEYKPLTKDFKNLTYEQIDQELGEILATYSEYYKPRFTYDNQGNRIKWKDCSPDKYRQIVESELGKGYFDKRLRHCTNAKQSIKTITIQPLGEKPITANLATYSIQYDQSKKGNPLEHKPNYKRLNDCLKTQVIKKDLPSAKDFHFIKPNGKPKAFIKPNFS